MGETPPDVVETPPMWARRPRCGRVYKMLKNSARSLSSAAILPNLPRFDRIEQKKNSCEAHAVGLPMPIIRATRDRKRTAFAFVGSVGAVVDAVADEPVVDARIVVASKLVDTASGRRRPSRRVYKVNVAITSILIDGRFKRQNARETRAVRYYYYYYYYYYYI